MSDLESASPSPAGTGEGIAPASAGQASAPAASVSTLPARAEQPGRTAEPLEQPQTPAGESRQARSAEDWERDYKALQAAYTRTTQAVSQLGDLSQAAQAMQMVQQLREDPQFLEWVQRRLAAETAGSDDDDTVKALQIVDSRARQIAAEMVAPLQATALENKVQTVFAEMDKAHGQEWQTLKPRMLQILQQGIRSGQFSPSVETNFDYGFVQGLYAMAASQDPDFAAKQYQKRLAQKQSQVTASQPGVAPSGTTSGTANSFEEAYLMARRQHGLS